MRFPGVPMIASDLERQLDNPIWSCLATRQAHLAQGDARVRRYPASISPLTGLAGEGLDRDIVASLAAVVPVGDDTGIFGPAPALGPAWEVLRQARITQMIRRDDAPLDEGDVGVCTLDERDVPQMLELVALTQPGPFRPRTIELGRYIGIRENGRLLAMAGERMWLGDYREASAICTHPDARGRGYARALIGRVINRMLRAGETPFLHVYSTNTQAIDVYLDLGFVRRAEFDLLHARRLS
jgi:ribosomal protein S18 acetylase RimI-like enzyme